MRRFAPEEFPQAAGQGPGRAGNPAAGTRGAFHNIRPLCPNGYGKMPDAAGAGMRGKSELTASRPACSLQEAGPTARRRPANRNMQPSRGGNP